MSEDHIRKTQARAAEREQRRARQARNERLKWQIPLAAAGVLALLAVAYFVFTPFARPSQAVIAGVNGPHFQVDNQKLDLGDQVLGTTVRVTFNVKNTGGSQLSLNTPQMPTVVKGCCPTALTVGQSTLNPGEATTISFNMMMHQGMGGQHLFEIPVQTNDPKQPQITLQVASNWK